MQDFYDLTWAYLERAHAEGVVHVEPFFDPQTHTERNVPFGTAVKGVHAALKDAEAKWGMTSGIIICFLRHLGPEAALKCLEEVDNKPSTGHLGQTSAAHACAACKTVPQTPFAEVHCQVHWVLIAKKGACEHCSTWSLSGLQACMLE